MIAFETSVNGRHLQTIAVGELGMLSTNVMWSRVQNVHGPILENFRLSLMGLEGNQGDSLSWPDVELKVGEVVEVRIVETDNPAADPPTARMTRAALKEQAKRRPRSD